MSFYIKGEITIIIIIIIILIGYISKPQKLGDKYSMLFKYLFHSVI